MIPSSDSECIDGFLWRSNILAGCYILSTVSGEEEEEEEEGYAGICGSGVLYGVDLTYS